MTGRPSTDPPAALATALPTAAPRLVIAGLSVRAAAQAARREGWRVIGLDLFGDADTRAACDTWLPLCAVSGAPWQVDAAGLRADLALLLRDEPGLLGLIPTGGFATEGVGLADLPLPLLATAPADIARLRDPAAFFDALDAFGIAHPEVALRRPSDLALDLEAGAWLRKDFAGSGGAQVRPARPDDVGGPGVHWQRAVAGEPLSLTALGNGRQAAVLGVNRQLVDPTPAAPYRHGGVIGPLPRGADGHAAPGAEADPDAVGLATVDGALQTRVQGLADRLAGHFALRGLFSIDLIRAPDGRLWVLEVNPRPSASLALYGPGVDGPGVDGAPGPITAHLDAVRFGRLPDAAAIAALRGDAGPADRAVRGQAIVYADGDLTLDAVTLARLADATIALGLADRPFEPVAVPAGAPICSVTATGRSVAAVHAALLARRQALAAATES